MEGRMFNWSAHTKRTLPFNCNNTIQYKTMARKAPIDESKGAQARKRVRRVSMIGKTCRCETAQGTHLAYFTSKLFGMTQQDH